jgi:hypothetical protein
MEIFGFLNSKIHECAQSIHLTLRLNLKKRGKMWVLLSFPVILFEFFLVKKKLAKKCIEEFSEFL